MKNSSHFDNAKAVISLLIVLIGLGVLMLFVNNRENIMEGERFYTFVTYSVIGFSLLIGLLYLVSNSKSPSVRVNKTAAKKHKKGRK